MKVKIIRIKGVSFLGKGVEGSEEFHFLGKGVDFVHEGFFLGLEGVHVGVDSLIVLIVIVPFAHGPSPSAVRSPDSTVQIKNPSKFLRTLTDSPAMGLNLFIHVFGVGFFLDSTGDIRLLAEGVVLVGVVMGEVLLLRGFAVETLFVGFLVFDVVDDLVGGDLYLFEDVLLVGLGLDLDCLVDHVAQLAVSFVQLSVSLDQRVVPRSIGSVFIFQLIDSRLELLHFFVQSLLIFGEFFVSVAQFLTHFVRFFHSLVRVLQLCAHVCVLLL